MRLKKISLKNIRSYKEEEIIFPKGSVLLAGDIGCGKTSLLLAIEYSLFGLQPGQKGSSLMRNNATSGSVSLELEIDGKDILIERRLKRQGKSITNEYSAITIDGNKLESSLTEIKIKILEAIGYPKDFVKRNNLLYRYTVYTPQEEMKQIILENPENRLNVLRYILGIDKYMRIRENLSILLTNLKEESKILQGEIKLLDEEKIQAESKNEFLKSIEHKIKEKEIELNLKINRRKDLELESTGLKNKIKEKEYLEKEAEKQKMILTARQESLSTLNLEISEIESNLSDSTNAFNEQDYKKIMGKIQEKSKLIENFYLKYSNKLGEINSLEENKTETIQKRERIFKIDICPTCLQDVSETHKHNILNETEKVISTLKSKRSSLEIEISQILSILNKEKPEKEELETKKASFDMLKTHIIYMQQSKIKLQKINKTRKILELDIFNLENKITQLRLQISNFSNLEGLHNLKIEELKESLNSERQTEISIAEFKKEHELTKNQISELKERISLKEKSKERLSNILELSDWLSTHFMNLITFTERNVLLKLRQEFSRMFSKWFRMLVPEESLEVRLDESFSPIVMHNETEMEYSFLSGGEKTAISLAYRLALNQIINSLLSKIKTKNIIILDEPTDGFSDVQLDKMRSIFEDLDVSQLIIVSHEQKIESFVDNILRIKKTGEVSNLENSNTQSLGLTVSRPDQKA